MVLMWSTEPDISLSVSSGLRIGSAVVPAGGMSRRRVLILAPALGLGLAGGLTACTGPAAVTAPLASPEPDELAIDRAVSATRQLRAAALALATTDARLAPLLRRIAAGHAAQLNALGAEPAVSPSTTASAPAASAAASASPTSAGTPSADDGLAATTATLLAEAEWTAARTALRDGEATTGPAIAVLLCRTAAAMATNADLITAAQGRPPHGDLKPAATPAPSASATPLSSTTGSAAASPAPATPYPDPSATNPFSAAPSSTAVSSITVSSTAASSTAASSTTASSTAASSTTASSTTVASSGVTSSPRDGANTALNRLLAGQHAAVFAYPLIVARAAANRRQLARTLWQVHRSERDAITELLLAEGAQPVPPAAAYEITPEPTSGPQTVALAARVERGLAALAADLIAASTGANRDLGADQLVLAARRTASWTGTPSPFPGLTSQTSPTASSPTP